MKVKKILCSAIVSILCLSISITNVNADNTDNSMYVNSSIETNSNGNVAYNNDIVSDRNLYCVNLYKDIFEDVPTGYSDNLYYPDNYAGAYIDSNDTLHIRFTDKIEDNSKLYSQKLSAENSNAVSDGYIVYEEGEFSINYLKEIINTIYPVMSELEIGEGFLNQTENRVEIGVNDISNQSNILSFLENNIDNFNENSVCFFYSDGLEDIEPNTSDDINTYANTSSSGNYALAGSEIECNFNGSATIGFNAYDNRTGKVGVVTVAHFTDACKSSLGYDPSFFSQDSLLIGTYQKSILGGDIDAAFVSIDTAWHESVQISPSSEIAQLNDKLASYFLSSELVEGMNTRKVGITTNVTNGTLKSTDAFGYNSNQNISYNNLFYASNTQSEGDSGAPVFFPFVGPVQWGQKSPDILIGMACFKSNNNSYVYGCKADVIMQKLGVSLYTE